MTGTPLPPSTAPNSLFGTLRSWLQSWTNEFRERSGHVPSEGGAWARHYYGSVLVLVVDDNPLNLMLISALLEARGLVPVLAADGAEAVALSSELDFDLILMDLQMPILDGLGATSAIRHFERTSMRPAVPILAYSSTFPSAAVLASCGMSGSLAKPCEDQDLEECLVRWCPAYRAAPTVPGAGGGLLPGERNAPSATTAPRRA